jgi:hypothetical protein
MSQASPTYIKALHTPWYHAIYGFCRVSLAEDIIVLRVYSHLLQVADSYMLPSVLSVPCGRDD